MQWGVIFDMDGTMVDNNPYHLKAWQAFCKQHGRTLTENEYKEKLSGKNNTDTLRYLFDHPLSEEEMAAYKQEKEALYRELYAPHVTPINGLPELIRELYENKIPMAVATSATPVNIQFALDKLPFGKYFAAIIDSTQVKRGKPHPEIYLAAATAINIAPYNCIVFEDSLTGIAGARAAGATVVGITTAHTAEELHQAHYTINDYTQFDINALLEMLFL
jgi:beta-phosphoglucomutase family hydrolase